MSILDRLNLLIRSNINDSMGRQGRSSTRKTLSEMESSLRDARRQQVELRRGEKALIEQIRQARDKVDQWEERAMLALRSGDEDLAREALVVKNQAIRDARNLRDQLDDHRAYIKDIERALEALEVKLEGTRSRMRALSSSSGRRSTGGSQGRQSRDVSDWDAEMKRRARERRGESGRPRPSVPDPEVNESFDTSSSFREMNRMASKIDGMEAEIEAMRELDDIGGDPRRTELESIFKSMEGSRRRSSKRPSSGRSDSRSSRGSRRRPSDEPPLDDDLADLKKKFE